MFKNRLIWLLALLVEFCYLVIFVVDHRLLQIDILSWLIQNAVNLIIVNLQNCSTIQNLDSIDMAGPTDLLKPERFWG